MRRVVFAAAMVLFLASSSLAATFRLGAIGAMDPGHNERRSGFGSGARVERYFLELRPELLSTYVDLSPALQYQGVQPWRTPEVAGGGLDYYKKAECWEVEQWRGAFDVTLTIKPFGTERFGLYNRWYNPIDRHASGEAYWWRAGIQSRWDWDIGLFR